MGGEKSKNEHAKTSISLQNILVRSHDCQLAMRTQGIPQRVFIIVNYSRPKPKLYFLSIRLNACIISLRLNNHKIKRKKYILPTETERQKKSDFECFDILCCDVGEVETAQQQRIIKKNSYVNHMAWNVTIGIIQMSEQKNTPEEIYLYTVNFLNTVPLTHYDDANLMFGYCYKNTSLVLSLLFLPFFSSHDVLFSIFFIWIFRRHKIAAQVKKRIHLIFCHIGYFFSIVSLFYNIITKKNVVLPYRVSN